MTPPTPTGTIAGIVEAFLKGPLSIIVIVASLLRYGQLPPEIRYDPAGKDRRVE